MGYRLPVEPQLARHLNVSRDCLRAALDTLREENLIERIPRRGTFVKSLSEKQNVNVYYLLPCPDFMLKSGPIAAQTHMEAMSGALKAAGTHEMRLIPVPASKTNEKKNIDLERLKVITPGSRVFIIGISWYWKIFPLLRDMKCRVAGTLTVPIFLPECQRNGWQTYFHAGYDFLEILIQKLHGLGSRRPLFVSHAHSEDEQERIFALTDEKGIKIDEESFMRSNCSSDELRAKLAAHHKKSAFDAIFFNFADFQLRERESLNHDLGMPQNMPIIAGGKFPFLSELRQKPHYFHMDNMQIASDAVEWLVSNKKAEIIMSGPSFFRAEQSS
ncbi:MAG: hypothetical protein A2X49_07510 [Lentisphaerae bacterium GWF2_52_8]|nr:MAG: hypothetical protein A2X49_07510 [Lentisphaerae bacterium GWF2_52_8]